MIELRRTTSDDPRFLAAVALLDAEMWRRYGEVQGAYAPFNRVEGLATVVVALDGDRVVGCGCFKPFTPADAELKRMYVVDDARGQRIGARVLTTLETWARELGYGRMLLETGPKQPEAIALYRRQGYLPIEPFGPYVDLTATSLCMARTLLPSAP